MGCNDNFGSTFPFGLPKCDSIIILALFLINSFIKGSTTSILELSLILLSIIGTFKSNLIIILFIINIIYLCRVFGFYTLHFGFQINHNKE